MTNREKAICMVFTGVSFFKGDELKHFYKYVEELKGRPVYTHEFISFSSELKEKSRKDFLQLCANTNEWISIDDRLPEKDGKYLVARIHGNEWSISVRKFRKELPPVWWTGWGGHWERRTAGIRYWQPLPLPPNE